MDTPAEHLHTFSHCLTGGGFCLRLFRPVKAKKSWTTEPSTWGYQITNGNGRTWPIGVPRYSWCPSSDNTGARANRTSEGGHRPGRWLHQHIPNHPTIPANCYIYKRAIQNDCFHIILSESGRVFCLNDPPTPLFLSSYPFISDFRPQIS